MSTPTVSLTMSMDDAYKTIGKILGKPEHVAPVATTGSARKFKLAVAKASKKVGRPKGSKNKPKDKLVKAAVKKIAKKLRKATKVKKARKVSRKQTKKTPDAGLIHSVLAFLHKNGTSSATVLAKAVGAKGKVLGGIIGSHNRWTKTPRVVMSTIDGEKNFALEAQPAAALPPAPAAPIAFETSPT